MHLQRSPGVTGRMWLGGRRTASEDSGQMTDVIEIIVPLIPPSLNHYVKHTRRGHHYVTNEAKAFKAAVGLFAKGQRIRLESYYIEIWLNLGKGHRLDLDN